ncbi:alanyl-tRNA synthetase [Oleidesulfovibrio sp.]|uniref:alanyl-tRNA synthetase n=1 Tax=Oleidesulfovibrio sp. TaxID=2909707 RepID=UPI003A841776
MNTIQREKLAKIMKRAWKLAKEGASRFGGVSKLYFPCALKMSWALKDRTPSVWRKDVGNQFWMDCIPLPQQTTKHGQIFLPGIGK